MTDWKFCSLVTVRRKTLTLGLFILARWPPADAGLVFVQIEEPHQSLGATAKLHHLGPHLHGAHTFLHWRQENKTDRGKNKIGTLSKGKVCCNWKQRVTDKKMCIRHVFIQEIESGCVCVSTKFHLGSHGKRSYLLMHSHEHIAMQSNHIGYACQCWQGFPCLVGRREKKRRQTTARGNFSTKAL